MRRRSSSLCLFLFLGLFALVAGCEKGAESTDAAPAEESAPATQTDG